MTAIKPTTKTPITANFTNYRGEWMIRTDRKITKNDYIAESREVIGGSKELVEVCYVEVTLRSGAAKTVEVCEFEAHFKAKDGRPESYLYSVI